MDKDNESVICRWIDGWIYYVDFVIDVWIHGWIL